MKFLRSSPPVHRFPLLCLVLTFTLLAGTVRAGTVKGSNTGNFTSGGVKGSNWLVGSTVTITYATTPPTVVQVTVNANDGFWSPQPKGVPNGTAFTAVGKEADETNANVSGKLAQLFTLPSNQVVTNFTVLAGSTVTVGANTVPLVGQFTSIENAFDGDPSSPTYGKMSGNVLTSGFSLGSPSIGLTMSPMADIPFSLNVAAVDLAAQSPDFVSASVPVPATPLNMLINYNNQVYSASGSVTGTGTFVIGDQNTYTFDATLSSSLGPVTVHLVTFAPSYLSVPEPSSLMSLGLGILLILSYAGWRYRQEALALSARTV